MFDSDDSELSDTAYYSTSSEDGELSGAIQYVEGNPYDMAYDDPRNKVLCEEDIPELLEGPNSMPSSRSATDGTVDVVPLAYGNELPPFRIVNQSKEGYVLTDKFLNKKARLKAINSRKEHLSIETTKKGGSLPKFKSMAHHFSQEYLNLTPVKQTFLRCVRHPACCFKAFVLEFANGEEHRFDKIGHNHAPIEASPNKPVLEKHQREKLKQCLINGELRTGAGVGAKAKEILRLAGMPIDCETRFISDKVGKMNPVKRPATKRETNAEHEIRLETQSQSVPNIHEDDRPISETFYCDIRSVSKRFVIQTSKTMMRKSINSPCWYMDSTHGILLDKQQTDKVKVLVLSVADSAGKGHIVATMNCCSESVDTLFLFLQGFRMLVIDHLGSDVWDDMKVRVIMCDGVRGGHKAVGMFSERYFEDFGKEALIRGSCFFHMWNACKRMLMKKFKICKKAEQLVLSVMILLGTASSPEALARLWEFFSAVILKFIQYGKEIVKQITKRYFRNPDQDLWFAGAFNRLDYDTGIRILRSNNYAEGSKRKIKDLIGTESRYIHLSQWQNFVIEKLIPLESQTRTKEFMLSREVYDQFLAIEPLSRELVTVGKLRLRSSHFLLRKDNFQVTIIDEYQDKLDNPKIFLTLCRDYFVLKFDTKGDGMEEINCWMRSWCSCKFTSSNHYCYHAMVVVSKFRKFLGKEVPFAKEDVNLRITKTNVDLLREDGFEEIWTERFFVFEHVKKFVI